MYGLDPFISILVPHGLVSQMIGGMILAIMCLAFLSSAWAGLRHRRQTRSGNWRHAADSRDIENIVDSAWDRLAESAPGVVLLLGLLGTFLGLALAINSASEGLQSLQGATEGPSSLAVSHLSSLLDNMGTKFQTSIWGIAASIVIRAFVFMLSVVPKRKLVHEIRNDAEKKAVEGQDLKHVALMNQATAIGESLGLVIRAIDASERRTDRVTSAMAKQSTLLGQFFVSLEQCVKEEVGTPLGKVEQRIRELDRKCGSLDGKAADIREGILSVGNAAASLEKSASTISSAASELRMSVSASAEQNQRVVEESSKSLTKAADELRVTLSDSVSSLTSNMRGSIEELRAAVRSMEDTTRSAVQEGNSAIKGAIERFQQESGQTLAGVRSGLTSSVESMGQQIAGGIGSLATAAGRISESAEKMDERSEAGRKQFQGLVQSSIGNLEERLGVSLGSLGEQVDRMSSSFTESIGKSDASMKTAIENLRANLAEQNNDMRSELGKASKDLSSSIVNAERAAEQGRKSFAGVVESTMSGVGGEMRSSIAELDVAVGNMSHNLVQAVASSSEAMSDAIGELRRDLGEQSAELRQASTKSADSISERMQTAVSGFRESTSSSLSQMGGQLASSSAAIAESNGKSLSTLSESIEAIEESLSRAIDEMRNANTDAMEQSDEKLGAMSHLIARATENSAGQIEIGLQQTSEKIGEFGRKMDEGMSSIADGIDAVKKYSNDITGTIEMLQGNAARQEEQTEELKDAIAKLGEAMAHVSIGLRRTARSRRRSAGEEVPVE